MRAGTRRDGRTATEPDDAGGARIGPSLPEPRESPDPQHRSAHAAAPDAGAPRAAAAGADPGRSDAELLRLHVAGDPDAFGELFLRHRDRLWAVAIRTLSDPEEAADAVQDAMISAFRRAGSFRGDSAVTTWLHRIVVNACLDRMRRSSARPIAGTADESTLDSLAMAGGRPDPSSVSDTALDVTAALRRLPADQQAALVLVDMLGYPVAEAASILRVSQGTVKSRCSRGRAKLLPRLAHLRQGPVPGQAGRNRSATPDVLPAQGGGEEPS